jgi:hypothetical protein
MFIKKIREKQRTSIKYEKIKIKTYEKSRAKIIN